MNNEDDPDLGFLNAVKSGLEDGLRLDPAELAAIRRMAAHGSPVRWRRPVRPILLALAASLALVLGLGFLVHRMAGAGATVPLTAQAIVLIGEEADDDYDAVVPGDAAAACDSLRAWQDAPYEAVAKTVLLEDNILP